MYRGNRFGWFWAVWLNLVHLWVPCGLFGYLMYSSFLGVLGVLNVCPDMGSVAGFGISGDMSLF